MNPELDWLRAFHVALRIRMTESRIAEKYHEGRMRCPVHLSIGQEIPSALFEQVKKVGDIAVSTHRSHAHFLAMGGSLNNLIAELYGKVSGCSRGRGGSMHLTDLSQGFLGSSSIVGNSIPVGVGVALAKQIDNDGGVSFVFLGDGAVEEGVFFESANFSVVHRLPVVFIVENNLYSVYTGLAPRQPKERAISDLASAIGLQSETVSDTRFLDLFEKMSRLTEYSRNGSGPTLLEVNTYRRLEHCGPNDDDHLGYRPADEIQRFKNVDLVEVLQSEAKVSTSELRAVTQRFEREIDEAFRLAEMSAFPPYAEILSDVYAD